MFEKASGGDYLSSKQVLSSCLGALALLSDGRGTPLLHTASLNRLDLCWARHSFLSCRYALIKISSAGERSAHQQLPSPKTVGERTKCVRMSVMECERAQRA